MMVRIYNPYVFYEFIDLPIIYIWKVLEFR